MAIEKPNFSNIGNYNSGTTIKKRTSTSGDEGPNRLQHYINDDSFNKNYKDFIGTINPAYESLKESDSGVNESFHTQKYINKFKTCDLIIGNAMNWPLITSKDWGNWKNLTDIKVNDKIFLDPDIRKLNFSYELKYASIWEEVLKLKAIGAIDSTARDARIFTGQSENKIFIPVYKEAPAFTGSTPLSVSSSVRFNFQFGQSGLFSGEEEVYKPIIALAKVFAPNTGDTGAYLVDCPAPTLEQQMGFIGQRLTGEGGQLFSKIGKLGSAVGGDLKNTFFPSKKNEDGTEAESSEGAETGKNILGNAFGVQTAQALTDLQAYVYDTISAAIRDNLSGVKAICIRLGRLTLPPMIVHNVSWEFDTTQVDEYGFPFAGYIEFGGLETAKLTTKRDMNIIDN